MKFKLPGYSSIKKIECFTSKENKNSKILSKNFKKNLPRLLLPDERMFNNSSHHLYIINWSIVLK